MDEQTNRHTARVNSRWAGESIKAIQMCNTEQGGRSFGRHTLAFESINTDSTGYKIQYTNGTVNC